MSSQTIVDLLDKEASSGTTGLGADSTRYLCAGTHLDNAFRSQVIETLVEEKHRAVEIPEGLDIEALVDHARLAEKRSLTRNLLLLPLFVPAAFCLISYATQEPDIRELSPVVYILWLVGAAILFFEDLIKARTLRTLRKGGAGIHRNKSSRTSPALSREAAGNLVVYSGFTPFVGAGIELGGWSFVIRLDSEKKELGLRADPIPFKNSELYAHIRSRVNGLGLEGLQIQDKLYVNGKDVREDSRFLPNPMAPPVRKVGREIVNAFEEGRSQLARHYMGIHMIQWKGEVVVSCFLRMSQQGCHLFVEASYFLLPPVKEFYYSVDALPPAISAREIWTLTLRSVISAPVLCAISPFAVWAKFSTPWRKNAERRETERMIKENYSFDYGAKHTVRSIAASTNYRRYFQKLDKEMAVKLVERCVLDSLVEFLDEKNVDTSDIKERTSMILNNGVIVAGGSIQADTFTAGQGAISNVMPKAGRTAARDRTKEAQRV